MLWYQNPSATMSYSIFTQPTRESLQWNNAQGLLSTGLVCRRTLKRQETDMPNATATRHHKQPHHQNPPHPHPLHLTKSSDFFDYGGHHYLIVGDHLSGWVEVLSSTSRTNLGGSPGLVLHLRKFFTTFSVLEELWSDGGP